MGGFAVVGVKLGLSGHAPCSQPRPRIVGRHARGVPRAPAALHNQGTPHSAVPMHLPWLNPGDPFPDPSRAWDHKQPAPGLLAAGGALDVATLARAYGSGIFPWFSE